MKKLIILAIISLLQADYIDLVNKIINYHIDIKNKIYNPFYGYKQPVYVSYTKDEPQADVIVKLIAIFNNKALLQIDDIQKWVKVQDDIGCCKIIRITPNSVYLSDKRVLKFTKKIDIKVK